MDWNNHNAEFTNHDLDTFEYEGHQKQVEIIYKKTIDDVSQPLSNRCSNYMLLIVLNTAPCTKTTR